MYLKARSILVSWGIAIGLLLLALFFFAPHLWLMRSEVPDSFQWARANAFLKQCEQPFRHDIEPAMIWRRLPPLICHVIGLRGRTALLFPWLGIILMMTLAVQVINARLPERRLATLAALPLATSTAALIPLQWFGINDGWVWLGLIAVSFSRWRWAPVAAGLLCPWVDERFVIGLPLALIVRCLDRGEPPGWRAALPAAWLLPYLAIRLAFIGESSTQFFFTKAVCDSIHYLAYAPLGWWMALRAGWVLVAVSFVLMPREWRWPAGAVLALTLITMAMLAADVSRSAAIVVPMMIWGCVALCRHWPAYSLRLLGWLSLACLLIPMANIVYTKIDPVSPLPIELFRLWHIP